MKIIPLSELENLSGNEPGELYKYAGNIGFKVVIWGNDTPLPVFLKEKTLYGKLNDWEQIDRVWVNEDHLDLSK